MEVRFRHLSQVLPLSGNLEPIFLVVRVGSTLGLFVAIRCLSSALAGRKQIIGHNVGHFVTTSSILATLWSHASCYA